MPEKKQGELVKMEQGQELLLSGMVDEKTVRDFLVSSGTASKLTEPQQNLFMLTAKALNLNPLKREIYVTPYLKKGVRAENAKPGDYDMSIVTGYEVYLKRAERAKNKDGESIYDGFDKPEFEGKLKVEKKTVKYKDDNGQWKEYEKDMMVDADPDDPFRCTVKVWRKDRNRPTIHTVYWSECTQNNAIWNEKPRTMLRKVALCQAFRLAFPDEFDGMPYAEEELPADRGIIESTPEPKKLTHDTAAAAPNPDEARLAALRQEVKDIALSKKIPEHKLNLSIARRYAKDGMKVEDCTEEQLNEVKSALAEAAAPADKEQPKE
jgi:phage recombination protein Bet